MKQLLDKIKLWMERRRYNLILYDRQHLTDYEREQLIPEIRARVSIMRQYFVDIIELCDVQKGLPGFVRNLRSVINPRAFETPAGTTEEDIANAFYDGIKRQAQEEGIRELDNLLAKYSKIDYTRELGLFLNEVNILCSSFLVVNDRLFLFRIDGYPILTNTRTGEIINTQPPQYTVTTQPFQIIIENMIGIAKATSETVSEWHKYSMKLKNQYLDLYTSRLSIRNAMLALWIQIITVVLAVTLSAFFLVATDPLDLHRKNQSLQKKVNVLEEEKRVFEKRLESVSTKNRNRN